VSTELTDAIRVRLESWLCSLRDQTDSGVASRAPLRKMIAEANAPDLRLLPADERTASPGIEISYGTADERVILLTQTLERQLAAVSRSRLT
jgi:hypothetical protein